MSYNPHSTRFQHNHYFREYVQINDILVENCIIIERLEEVDKYLPFYQFSFRNGIGRSKNTAYNYFLIDDPLINPHHIKIEFVKGKFYLYDMIWEAKMVLILNHK